MNTLFFSLISGMNIVIGAGMLCLLISGPTKMWPTLAKIGFFTMAAGLIAQAAYVIAGTSLSAPIWDQWWILKDIGTAMFTISLINSWISKTKV